MLVIVGFAFCLTDIMSLGPSFTQLYTDEIQSSAIYRWDSAFTTFYCGVEIWNDWCRNTMLSVVVIAKSSVRNCWESSQQNYYYSLFSIFIKSTQITSQFWPRFDQEFLVKVVGDSVYSQPSVSMLTQPSISSLDKANIDDDIYCWLCIEVIHGSSSLKFRPVKNQLSHSKKPKPETSIM